MGLSQLLSDVKSIAKAPHRAPFQSRYFVIAAYGLLFVEVLVLAAIIKMVPCESINKFMY